MSRLRPGERLRFGGHIAGLGSTSGVRLVLGCWADSPFGQFADVMVQRRDGHRLLLAPDREVADFVGATYTFDEVVVEPVTVSVDLARWQVRTPSLSLWFDVGRRTAPGVLLAAVPRRVATAPAWTLVTDPVARVAMPGVRTRGSAGGGRTETYGATDVRSVVAAGGALEGRDLGSLAPVDPPCRFGFASAPRRPSLTSVVTTVGLPSGTAS